MTVHGAQRPGQGFSFAPSHVFVPAMESYLESVIHRPLARAKAEGKDYLGQTEEAVRPGRT